MWKYNQISKTWDKIIRVGFFTLVFSIEYDETLSSYFLKMSMSGREKSLLTSDIDSAKEMADIEISNLLK